MSGLINAFSQGMSSAGYAGGDLYGKEALEDQRNQAEIMKAQTLEKFKTDLAVNTADQQRVQMMGRIGTEAGNIADAKVADKSGLINSGIVDKDSWTSEQQAAVDQSLGADKASIAADRRTRMQAAENTGDISPEKTASMSSNMQLTQMKMDSLMARAEDRNSSQQQIAQIRADAILSSAQLRVDAANQRAANGKIDTATGRMLITSEDANIRASTSQLNMLNRQMEGMSPTKNGKPNPDYQNTKAQMDEIRDGIKQSQETKAGYLKTMGLMPSDPKPKAAPASPTTAVPIPGAPKNDPLGLFSK